MIVPLSYHTLDCPICGRPVEVQVEHISRKLACGHCSGQFVVSNANDGGLTATAHGGIDLLERVEQLLRRWDSRAECDSSGRRDR